MLYFMAIGDAYGAGFEYAKPDFVAANNDLSRYSKHPKHNLVPGVYTDDTQMSIANAEALCQHGRALTRQILADAYVACFKRDQREGYAGRFYDFLCATKDGTELLANINPASDKSGAAMRALPFGVFSDIDTVKQLTTLQAKITHDTTDGINAAIAAALMSHYFLYELGPKADLGTFLASHVDGPWDKTWSGSVGAQGWMSVQAAITAVTAGNGMADILKRSIAFTGDVDTVAALALGSVAASSEVSKDLPQVLIDGLEKGTYGSDFLKSLDTDLRQLMTV